ncbi:MAG: transposase [Thermodesulfobacteriota bacterium]|nr:transposase [Thermodesulfobacteriota bacterium]
MPRIARVCAIDYPHHITQRGNNREPVFFDNEDREFYLKVLSRYSRQWDFGIWAYCLMTNHVHILSVPRRQESFAKGLGSTNLVYTQYINRKYKRSGRLWQNRFFSTIVEDEPYLWAVIRYIENNPVRTGLVQNAEDYRWSSCKAHVSDLKDPILTAKNWLEEDTVQVYKEFLRNDDKKIEKSIRNATTTGRPLGSVNFIQLLEKKLGRSLLPKKAGRPEKKKGE